MMRYILLTLCLPYLAICKPNSSRLKEVDVKLYIFSEYNRDSGLEVLYENPKDDVPAVYYDKQKTNVFLIPGSNHTEFEKSLIPALLDTEKANVFLFKWIHDGQDDEEWKEKSIADAGHLMSKFLLKLKKTLNLALEKTQLVGEGIGAHVAGEVGKKLNGEIFGIIGLDPTYPAGKEISKLGKTDAKRVEVIHTEGSAGYPSSMGTLDFFVNGGIVQPGCDKFNLKPEQQKACSHSRSWLYYKESLQGGIFIGIKCSGYKYVKSLELEKCEGTYAILGGINQPEKPKGDFYVLTRPDGPEFALLNKKKPLTKIN
ncbi:unnamed protein product [Callosobruchus maculatus]|uniref:Lipase domain-containing protein n=1 Tax=Callosobruchus maculatus TaxID=64391 RepID=A0A653DKH1_CALMS|nr:unnamed protein product [Callosobruchus maculatus]